MTAAQGPWPGGRPADVLLTAHICLVSGEELGLRLRQVESEEFTWDTASLHEGKWQYREGHGTIPSAVEAVEKHGYLKAGQGRTIEIDADPSLLRTLRWAVAPPTPTPETREGWSEEAIARWTVYEDYLPFDLPMIELWAEINGATLLLLEPSAHFGRTPILYDWDNGEFVDVDVIVESSWFSESGGAPVSWNGGSSLGYLSKDLLLRRAWGDVESGCDLIPVSGPAEVGLAVADFIVSSGQQFMAAWELEGLNETGLPQEEIDNWIELVGSIELSLDLRLESPKELEACLERLNENPGYARVAAALRDPASAAGQELLERIETVAESQVLGDIMWNSL